MDGYYRNGELLDHKVKADEAVEAARKEGQEVDKVLVWRRYPGQYSSKTPMVKGRDFFVDELLADYRGTVVEPVSMPAEAPLFLMYTSGTTGQPKGCQHSTGGYLSYVAGTVEVLPGHPSRGHLLVLRRHRLDHRPLLHRVRPAGAGHHQRDVRGRADYPDAGRPWRIAERLGVNIFHTAPTTIRMLRKVGPDEPAKYDYHFKHMTTVGEPIEPEVWRWYLRRRRQGRGGHRRHLVADRDRRLPGQHPARPGPDEAGQLRSRPSLGIYPVILRRGRQRDRGGQREGRQHLHPQPVARHLPDDLGPAGPVRVDLLRQVQHGLRRARTGTTGRTSPATARCRPPDGYFRILGRVDDVINVAGHRLGTKELESAALTVDGGRRGGRGAGRR